MAYKNPWLNFYWPLSGDVKDISPVTTWFSPNYEINFAGNREIEARIISETASYGKQLGKLTAAVLEIADGEPGEAVENLRKLSADIEKAKNSAIQDSIKSQLEKLKDSDPEAYDKLLSELK
ncbi:MAG: hypothetical protein AAGJ37_06980 [Pseudomonadota bacterium]